MRDIAFYKALAVGHKAIDNAKVAAKARAADKADADALAAADVANKAVRVAFDIADKAAVKADFAVFRDEIKTACDAYKATKATAR